MTYYICSCIRSCHRLPRVDSRLCAVSLGLLRACLIRSYYTMYPRASSRYSDESYLVIDQVCIFAYRSFALTCLGWNMSVRTGSTYLAKTLHLGLRGPVDCTTWPSCCPELNPTIRVVCHPVSRFCRHSLRFRCYIPVANSRQLRFGCSE